MPLDMLGDHNETHDSIEVFAFYQKPGEAKIIAVNSRTGAPSIDINIDTGDMFPQLSLRFFGIPTLMKVLDGLKGKSGKTTTIMLDNDSYRFEMCFFKDLMYVTMHTVAIIRNSEQRIVISFPLSDAQYKQLNDVLKQTLAL